MSGPTSGKLSAGERARLLRRVAGASDPGAAGSTDANTAANLATNTGASTRSAAPDTAPRRAPATYAQEQLWFLDLLTPGNPNYNVPFVFTLTGRLDPAALRTALGAVAGRHTALRTVLRREGDELVQVVAPPSDVALPVEDFSREGDPATAAWQRCHELLREPFTLTEPPLWRAVLLRVRETEHLLVWVASHAVADGWAVGLLSQELAGCYRAALGTGAPMPPPSWQLTDFAADQRARLDATRIEELLDFWKCALRDCPPLRFPYDHPRPPVPSFRGATHAFDIPAEVMSGLARVAADLGTTGFAVALSCYHTLLSIHCRQQDVAVGVPVAGRDEPATQGLFGSLVNTVVVRADPREDRSFAELVRGVAAHLLDVYDHADLPFGKLVEHLRPRRADRFSPLVQTVFSYGSTPFTDIATTLDGEVEVGLTGVSNGTVRFDVELALDQSPTGWQGRLEYAVDLLAPESARALCERYLRLLREVLRDPHRPLSEAVAAIAEPGWPAEPDEPGSPVPPPPHTDDTAPSENTGPSEDTGPSQDVEATLLRLWRETLGSDTLTEEDDFFSAGGHSMLAANLVATIRDTFGCDLTLVEFFQALTVRELARLITPRIAPAPAEEIPEEVLRRVATMSDDEVAELLARLNHTP